VKPTTTTTKNNIRPKSLFKNSHSQHIIMEHFIAYYLCVGICNHCNEILTTDFINISIIVFKNVTLFVTRSHTIIE
jgi:hypothetical protein